MQSKRSSAILLMVTVGLFLILISWWQSYPLHLLSANSTIFSAISPTYWVGLGLTLPSLLVLSRSSKRRRYQAMASILILLVARSLSFFFFFPYGPDPFFRSLIDHYTYEGHINPVFQKEYWWAAFFILARQFEFVTSLPARIYEHIFLVLTGLLTATCVFLIIERRSVSPGGALFAFTVLSFFFWIYQFAPQTLALALLFLLLAMDFRPAHSTSSSIIRVALFTSLCLLHAFIPIFYIMYRGFLQFLRMKGQARGESQRTLPLVLFSVMYVTLLLFNTMSFFDEVVPLLYRSFLEGLGSHEYGRVFENILAPVQSQIPAFFSRGTILATGVLSSLGLMAMIRRRELTSKDLGLATAGAAYLLSGIPLLTFGQRAIQLLAVSGGLGAGYLDARRHTLLSMAFTVLAVTSISIQIHWSFNMYLFQDPISVQQVSFVSSIVGVERPTFFIEYQMSDMLRYNMVRRGLYPTIATERTRPVDLLAEYDYYAITPGLIHTSHVLSLPLSLPCIDSVHNRIVDDGRNWWIVKVR